MLTCRQGRGKVRFFIGSGQKTSISNSDRCDLLPARPVTAPRNRSGFQCPMSYMQTCGGCGKIGNSNTHLTSSYVIARSITVSLSKTGVNSSKDYAREQE